jgi:hypothetical protein
MEENKQIEQPIMPEQPVANNAAPPPVINAKPPVLVNEVAENVVINKKKPGRPRKNINNIPVEIHGIVQNPLSIDNKVEMAYYNPKLFKKLFEVFRAYNVGILCFVFDVDGIRIFAKDHLEKSSLLVFIDGRCLDWYYCRERVVQYHDREKLETIFGTIDKTNHKITMILTQTTFRSVLNIMLKESQYYSEGIFNIEVIHQPKEIRIAETMDSDANYPIKVTFDSKHFKKEISNVDKFSDAISFCKQGNGPLQMTIYGGKNISFTRSYGNFERLKVVSALANGDEMIVPVYIGYIKPFSNTCAGQDITIGLDKLQKMSLSTMLDKKADGENWCCYIKVYTETNVIVPAVVAPII